MADATTESKPILTEKLTLMRLTTILLIQANESYQIMVLYPFVVFMIRDFGVNEHEVGTYAGILSGTFCIAQFCSSFGWGAVSDVYGRRLSLIIGLTFGMIAMALFGISQNYFFAIGARVVGGFFNGNIGVLKSYIADITNKDNRSFAFSLMAIGWGLGSIVASVAGGVLCDLDFWVFSKKYKPSKYSYPYLMPCLIGSLVALTGLIFCIIFVQDIQKTDLSQSGLRVPSESQTPNLSRSRGGKKTKSFAVEVPEEESQTSTAASDISKPEPTPISEQDKLNGNTKRKSYMSQSSHSLPLASYSGAGATATSGRLAPGAGDSLGRNAFETESSNIVTSLIGWPESNINKLRYHYSLMASLLGYSLYADGNRTDSQQHGLHEQIMFSAQHDAFANDGIDFTPDSMKNELGQKTDKGPAQYDTVREMIQHTRLLITLVNQTLCNASFIIYGELVPIFCAELIKYGGLGMNSAEIGVALGVQGLVLVIWAFTVQPKLVLEYGLIGSSKVFAILSILVVLLVPACTFLEQHVEFFDNGEKNQIYIILIITVLSSLGAVAASVLMTATFCYVNNSVPNRNVGKANGLAQTIASLVRGVGPTFAGLMWSWSTTQDWEGHQYVGFTLSVLCFLMLFVLLFKIPKQLEKPYESQN